MTPNRAAYLYKNVELDADPAGMVGRKAFCYEANKKTARGKLTVCLENKFESKQIGQRMKIFSGEITNR